MNDLNSDRVDPIDGNMSDDELAHLAFLLEKAARNHVARRSETINLVKRLRSGRLIEEFRRNLEERTFKTTYSRDRIKTLDALVCKLRAELKPLQIETLAKQIELEWAETELESYREAERETQADRDIKFQKGVYAEYVWLIDRLFEEHGISRQDVGALTEPDVQTIATLIKFRRQSVIDNDSLDKTLRDARAY